MALSMGLYATPAGSSAEDLGAPFPGGIQTGGSKMPGSDAFTTNKHLNLGYKWMHTFGVVDALGGSVRQSHSSTALDSKITCREMRETWRDAECCLAPAGDGDVPLAKTAVVAADANKEFPAAKWYGSKGWNKNPCKYQWAIAYGPNLRALRGVELAEPFPGEKVVHVVRAATCFQDYVFSWGDDSHVPFSLDAQNTQLQLSTYASDVATIDPLPYMFYAQAAAESGVEGPPLGHVDWNVNGAKWCTWSYDKILWEAGIDPNPNHRRRMVYTCDYSGSGMTKANERDEMTRNPFIGRRLGEGDPVGPDVHGSNHYYFGTATPQEFTSLFGSVINPVNNKTLTYSELVSVFRQGDMAGKPEWLSLPKRTFVATPWDEASAKLKEGALASGYSEGETIAPMTAMFGMFLGAMIPDLGNMENAKDRMCGTGSMEPPIFKKDQATGAPLDEMDSDSMAMRAFGLNMMHGVAGTNLSVTAPCRAAFPDVHIRVDDGSDREITFQEMARIIVNEQGVVDRVVTVGAREKILDFLVAPSDNAKMAAVDFRRYQAYFGEYTIGMPGMIFQFFGGLGRLMGTPECDYDHRRCGVLTRIGSTQCEFPTVNGGDAAGIRQDYTTMENGYCKDYVRSARFYGSVPLPVEAAGQLGYNGNIPVDLTLGGSEPNNLLVGRYYGNGGIKDIILPKNPFVFEDTNPFHEFEGKFCNKGDCFPAKTSNEHMYNLLSLYHLAGAHVIRHAGRLSPSYDDKSSAFVAGGMHRLIGKSMTAKEAQELDVALGNFAPLGLSRTTPATLADTEMGRGVSQDPNTVLTGVMAMIQDVEIPKGSDSTNLPFQYKAEPHTLTRELGHRIHDSETGKFLCPVYYAPYHGGKTGATRVEKLIYPPGTDKRTHGPERVWLNEADGGVYRRDTKEECSNYPQWGSADLPDCKIDEHGDVEETGEACVRLSEMHVPEDAFDAAVADLAAGRTAQRKADAGRIPDAARELRALLKSLFK